MITENEIEHIAKLSKLRLTDEEKKKLIVQMGDIISFANKISELDTENIIPTAHVQDMQNVFREDVIIPSYKRDEIIMNAPKKEAGCFLVPPTM